MVLIRLWILWIRCVIVTSVTGILLGLGNVGKMCEKWLGKFLPVT